jgi:hypothetical protein
MAKRSRRKAGAEGRGLSINRFNNQEIDLERKNRITGFNAQWIDDFGVSKRVEGDGFSFSASLKF